MKCYVDCTSTYFHGGRDGSYARQSIERSWFRLGADAQEFRQSMLTTRPAESVSNVTYPSTPL